MHVSRRAFLRGTIALAASTTLSFPRLAHAIPAIYGDGVHDDAPGLQALLDGEPFRVKGTGFVAQSGRLYGGSFKLGSTLHVRNPHSVVRRATFSAGETLGDAPLLFIHETADMSGLNDMHLHRGSSRTSGPVIAARYAP